MESKGTLNIEVKVKGKNNKPLEFIIEKSKLDCNTLELISIIDESLKLFIKAYQGVGYTEEKAKKQLCKIIDSL